MLSDAVDYELRRITGLYSFDRFAWVIGIINVVDMIRRAAEVSFTQESTLVT